MRPWFVADAHASVRPMDVVGLRDLVVPRRNEFLAELEAMVNVDCGSYTPDGVNEVVDRCERRFRDWGWMVDRRPARFGEQRLGDLLIGRLDGSGGRRILLVGHTDTVFDPGTAQERPFTMDGSIAKGPGVSDMKGGLLTGMFAVQALRDAGIDAFGHITYVCNPDEEIGSPFSGPVIRQLAADHDVAFVLEGGRENGDIVSARKGITDYTLTVHGRAAHAGVEPERGRSAIAAAADLTTRLRALNGRWPGVTLNVGTIHGGTRTNVVPERCVLELDLRSPVTATLEEAEQEIERICGEPSIPDVTVDVERASWHRPMERTDAIAALAARAASFASELGVELHDAATGGASDANTIAAVGTPVLDALGPVGGDDHAPGEWIDIESIVPRIAVLAALIGLP
jgi:glutamate carboxypeptidase